MKKGFTLVELLVVIAIIGVLAAAVLVSVSGARAKSVDAALEKNLAELQKIIAQCANNSGTVGLSDGVAPSGDICTDASPAVTVAWPVNPAGTTAKGTSGTAWTWTAASTIAYDEATGEFQFAAESDTNTFTCHQNGCEKDAGATW